MVSHPFSSVVLALSDTHISYIPFNVTLSSDCNFTARNHAPDYCVRLNTQVFDIIDCKVNRFHCNYTQNAQNVWITSISRIHTLEIIPLKSLIH